MKYISLFIKYSNYKALVVLTITNIFLTVLNLLYTFITGQYIDLLTTSNKKLDITYFILFFLCISVFILFVNYFIAKYKAKVKAKLSYSIDLDIIKNLRDSRYKEVYDFDATYIFQRMNIDSNEISNYIVDTLVGFITNIVIVVVTLIYALLLNHYFSFILLIYIPIYYFVYKKIYSQKLSDSNFILKENQSHLANTLHGQLDNFKYVKSIGDPNYGIDKTNERFNDFLSSLLRNVVCQLNLFTIGRSVEFVLCTIILAISGIMIINNKMTLGELTIINSLSFSFFGNTKELFSSAVFYNKFVVSANRILELLKLQKETSRDKKEVSNIISITLKDISYQYSYDSPQLFNIEALTFLKGKVYILKGSNGTGKTTLLDIIAGILDDFSGILLLNNLDIKTVDIKYYRKKCVSYLLQNTYVDEQCIYNAIHFNGNPCVKQLVQKLMDSIDIDFTNIVNINNLSGGEKRKLAFIDSIQVKKEIYIFDEPTNMMDKQGIMIVADILQQLSQDSIVIVSTHDSYLQRKFNMNHIDL